MATPEKNLRIPPSGPLADGTGAGNGNPPPNLYPPLDQVAGYAFRVGVEGEFTGPLYGAGNANESGAKIGPLGAINERTAYLVRSGTPEPASATALRDGLIGIDAASQAFGFTTGIWVVSACLSVGYNSTAPDTHTDSGSLGASIRLINPDGSELYSQAFELYTRLTTPVVSPAAATDTCIAVSNTLQSDIVIPITEAMVDEYGGPIQGFELDFIRYTAAPANSLGAYSADSGWLEVNRETNVTIRRIG